MLRILHVLVFIVFILVLSSCSGGDAASPDLDIDAALNPDSNPGIIVSNVLPDGAPSEGFGFMGLYTVRVDIDSLAGELTPLRSVSLEDVLETVDITNFLSLAPCTDCAKLQSVSLDADNNIVLSIGIRHPFPPGDPLKPISGQNRGDLHVFNVEGIVVTDSTGTVNFPELGVISGNSILLNADGATGYLDSSLDEIMSTQSDIHPYILHFDDFTDGNYDPGNPLGFESVTTPPPTGHLVMAMGSDYDFKDYCFNLSDTNTIEFIYAVGCTYAVSAGSKSLRFTPEYRLPQHNKKAATIVDVEIVSNDLGGGNTSSTAELNVKVVDVNHGIPVGMALNEMRADSSVNKIEIEIPGIMLSALDVPLIPSSGDGLTRGTPLVYPATITNTAAGDLGDYTGLIKVTDSCPSGLNESVLLNGLDGIKRVEPLINPLTGLVFLPEFAAYQIFTISVGISNLDPVADLAPSDTQVTQNDTITWDASASYDPDGTIELYEFDFILEDGDPANFVADVSGTEAIVESEAYPDLGNFVAALRVTDDLGATDIATSTLEVVERRSELTLDAVRATHSPSWDGGILRVHLDWEDMPAASEYAIYRSHLYADPYVWFELGTTTPPVSEFDDEYLQTFSWEEWIDHKYIYEVRPRTVPGDPSSEGLASQQALIFMESNDFDPQDFSSQAPVDPEQPNLLWNYGSGGTYAPVYSGHWRIDETTTPPWWWVNITNWDEPASSWMVYYTGLPIPDIEDQSIAYFDFAFSNGPSSATVPDMGFAPGTLTTPPASNDLTDFFDFDSAPSADYMLGEQYRDTFNSAAFENFFGDPAGTKAFHSQYYPFYQTRYKIMRLLETDVDYAAIGIASWNYTSGIDYHMWDSIAVVVY